MQHRPPQQGRDAGCWKRTEIRHHIATQGNWWHCISYPPGCHLLSKTEETLIDHRFILIKSLVYSRVAVQLGVRLCSKPVQMQRWSSVLVPLLSNNCTNFHQIRKSNHLTLPAIRDETESQGRKERAGLGIVDLILTKEKTPLVEFCSAKTKLN